MPVIVRLSLIHIFYVAADPVNGVDPSGLLMAESSAQNNQSKNAAGAKPVGPQVGTNAARSASTFEREFARQNYSRFFGRSVMRNGRPNPVTVGQGDFVDVNGIQRQFVGTNNFYGSTGKQLEMMAQRMKVANPQADFIGGQYGSQKHFEELALEHIQKNIAQIPDNSRVAVGVANNICKSRNRSRDFEMTSRMG